MTTELTDFEKELHRCSDLVLRWGETKPEGGVSLRELLTIDGISMWDVMAAELALYLIPDGLAPRAGRRTIRQILTPYLRPLKYAFWRKAPINIYDCARWPSGRTALFIGFLPYLARDVLQPVIDMMLGEEGLTPVLLTGETPGSSSEVAMWKHSVHCHRGADTVNEARRFAKAIRQVSAIVTGDVKYQRIFEEKGHQLWPLVEAGVRRAFNITASHLLPDTVAVARHILTKHRPAVIVSIDVADPRTRIYSLLGAALGIPTVQVQSGVVNQNVVEWRFLQDDAVAVQGTRSREVFHSFGVPDEKMHLTGSPRHDVLVDATDNQVTAFRQRFGVPQGLRTVIFASSYFLAVHENNLAETGILLRQMKKAIFMAVAATPGVFLIVKPHPLEDVAETRSFVVDHERVAFAEGKEDIRPLISTGDAFFSMGSTSTLDSLILGKPTVCPAFPGWTISDLFIRTGAVASPNSELEILAVMTEIARDGGAGIQQQHAAMRSEYLASEVCDGGHGASRRVLDLLNTLAQQTVPE